LNNPHVLQKAYAEVDRRAGPDINAKPSAQQVTSWSISARSLKGVAAAVADRAGLRLYPFQKRDDRRKYQAA